MKQLDRYKLRGFEVTGGERVIPAVIDAYMQETACHQLEALGIDDVKMHREDKQAFIISRMSLEIYGGIPVDEEIECSSWYSVGRAANFPRSYEFSAGGEVKARGYSNWALLDIDKKKIIRNKDYGKLSDELAEERAVLALPDKFRIPAEAELTLVDEFKVGYSMTDINRHMNNVKYVNPMCDNIPEIRDRVIKGFSIHYAHEAVEGEKLDVYVSQAFTCNFASKIVEDELIEKLYAEDDEIFYVRIKSGDEVKTDSMWVVSKPNGK